MKEIIEVYDLNGVYIKNQDRDDFYNEALAEFKKSGIVSGKIKTIRLLLMNSLGRIYLQKRSKSKKHNPGLYDKTVGGHVIAGSTFGLTVIKECVEELGFPSAIILDNEFDQAIKSIDLRTIAIIKKIDYLSRYDSLRSLKDNSSFVQPYITEFFIGYFDGPIRFADGESCGVETFSVDELKKEIHGNPEKFTSDLRFMVGKYSNMLIKINK